MTEKLQPDPELEPKSPRIWIFRHGPTPWNDPAEDRLQGKAQNDIVPEKIDAHLTRVGAIDLPRPNGFIVSSLRRTRQTALALEKLKGWSDDIPMYEDPDFDERSWGVLEGEKNSVARPMVINQPELRPPQFTDIYTLEDLHHAWDMPGFKFTGGESNDEVRARLLRGLARFVSEHPEGEFIMISHGAAMQSLGLDYHALHQFAIAPGSDEPVSIRVLNTIVAA